MEGLLLNDHWKNFYLNIYRDSFREGGSLTS